MEVIGQENYWQMYVCVHAYVHVHVHVCDVCGKGSCCLYSCGALFSAEFVRVV